MKTGDEIQRAHDLLVGIVLDSELFDQLVNADDHQGLICSLDVLCWVLGHDHNTSFAQNIRKLELRLEALGIRLTAHA